MPRATGTGMLLRFPFLGTLFVSVVFAPLSTNAQDSGERPPNVIVIYADDLGWGDLSSYGRSDYETPRLDRMAREGVRLTDFYVSVPYCAPSRAALLTGRHPFRTGVQYNPTPDAGLHGVGLDPEELTIAEVLQARGYKTAAIGKWHLGHLPRFYPRRHGFDEYYGILYSNDMRPVVLVEDELVVEYPVVQSFLTEKYTERALDFIERNKDEPFFLYLPHAMPHKPLAASEEFYTPETAADLYGDVMRELDRDVGRVLDRLIELDLAEDTLVIFTSDNGPWYGGSTGGLRGMKGSTWEGGLRVPMIAWWPGRLPAGETRSVPCATIDLLPTIAGLARAEVGKDDRAPDGVDIFPLLSRGEAPAERAIFGFAGTHLATVRKGRYKLHVRAPQARPRWTSPERWIDPRGPDGITLLAPFEQYQPTEYPSPPGGEPGRKGMLIDLVLDPGERKDVSSEHPDIVRELEALARKLEEEMPPDDPPPRGPELARGPGFVSPADPLPLDAVLSPRELVPSATIGDRYANLATEDYLGEPRVVATISDEQVFTEGPAQGPDGKVYFTNIPVAKILRFDPRSGALETFRERSGGANGLLFDPEGRLHACEGDARRVTRMDISTGNLEVLAAEYNGFPIASPNDLARDSQGRIWFSSRPGVKDPRTGNVNAVYRLDPDGTLVQVLAWPRVHMPNGLVLSPDESTLYLIEAHPDRNHHRDIRAYRILPSGELGDDERVIYDFYPGRGGDGMAIDSEGNLYVAAGLHATRGTSETLDTRPGIHVISPGGRLLAFRKTPEDTVTNCTFGGPDGKTLWVTSGTKLVAIPTKRAGRRHAARE